MKRCLFVQQSYLGFDQQIMHSATPLNYDLDDYKSLLAEYFNETRVLPRSEDIKVAFDGSPFDLVILAMDVPSEAISIRRRFQQEQPDCKVVLLTDCYHATKHYFAFGRGGVNSIILKSSGSAILPEAISKVLAGEVYCDPELDALINQGMKPGIEEFKLSKEDIQVLIRLDMRNKEIAEELDKPLRTIERYLEAILHKLGAPTRTTAALMAVRFGYTLLPKMNKDLFK